MRFFVPFAETPEIAEQTWEATRKFAERTTGHPVSDRRIFRIRYRHKKRDYEAEVGKAEPRTGEEVLVILEGTSYLVCTPNRGVLHDLPILVGKEEAFSVEDFEPGSGVKSHHPCPTMASVGMSHNRALLGLPFG